MSELTEFQRKRLENIKRNNDLLKKLHLSGVASQIKHEAGVSEKSRVSAKKKQKTTKSRATKPASPILPTRRSRRLRGESADDTKGIPNVNDNQLLKMSSPNGQEMNFIDAIKEKPVIGDVKLSDLIKDEDENTILEKFKRFNNRNFSSGDFFEEIKKRQGDVLGMDEFDLDLYDVFQPNEIKITYERISAAYFHPAVEKKLIIAGDTGGTVGLWNVRDEPLGDSEEDRMEEPDITRVKLFTKNVARIDCFPADTSKLLLTSYDGSIRSVHLNSLQSEEVLTLKNEYDDLLGVSDCQFSYENPHVLFLTTLGGEFTTFDTRVKKSEYKLRRLADKKIGSMAVNPLRPYEIATGSLDRTLKIWDTRHLVEKPEWSQYEDYPSYDIISTYDSRLSVSAVSYSPTDGTLVCNGYDDTIRLFDVQSRDCLSAELKPKLTIQHNCQTGRWTSILKARFKPNKNVFAIANMKRAIDIYNSEGKQLAHLPTATVPAVISWHPLQNWIAGGNSSGKIFLFTGDSRAIKQDE